jgi:hypothetical protein
LVDEPNRPAVSSTAGIKPETFNADLTRNEHRQADTEQLGTLTNDQRCYR